MDTNIPSRKLKTAPVAPEAEQLIRRMRSRDLFHNHKQVIIEHADQEYQLRITRQNKLILTK